MTKKRNSDPEQKENRPQKYYGTTWSTGHDLAVKSGGYLLEVEKGCRRILARKSNNPAATFEMTGKSDEAIELCKKALEIKPDFDLARVDLYFALKRMCSWNDLEAYDRN